MAKGERKVKSYTLAEAVEVIVKGNDIAAIADIGKRFPLATMALIKLASKAPSELVFLMSGMPDYMTLQKMNGGLKRVYLGDEDADSDAPEDAGETEEDEVEVTPKKAEKDVEATKKGRKPKIKIEEPEEVEEEVGLYDGKAPVELFKECQKRKIKAELKKPAKYYIELLEKDDKKKAKSKPVEVEIEEDEEEEEWDI